MSEIKGYLPILSSNVLAVINVGLLYRLFSLIGILYQISNGIFGPIWSILDVIFGRNKHENLFEKCNKRKWYT